MDIAIVTGAETPLGLRIVQHLVRQGCRVHGIGNNFSRVTYADPAFTAHPVDLTDTAAVRQTAADILESEGRLHILVHAVDVTPGAAFAQLPVGNLEAVLNIGLVGPALLTRLVWPNLLRFRGQLIQLLPANKSGRPASAVNALVEGALRRMNGALAEEAREAGGRVTTLILRQNPETDPEADPARASQSRVDPEHVLRTIDYLLDIHAANVPEEITLCPRLAPGAGSALPETAAPLDPYEVVALPPGGYFPPKQEKIPTEKPQVIDRTIPYSDEELEDRIHAAIEDYEARPEERDDKPHKQSGGKPRAERESGGETGKRRRSRRRGGRHRKGGETEAPGGTGGEGSARAHGAPDEPPPTPDAAADREAAPDAGKPSGDGKPNGGGEATEPPASASAPAKKTPKKKSVRKKAAKTKTATKKAAKKAPKKKTAKTAQTQKSPDATQSPGENGGS